MFDSRLGLTCLATIALFSSYLGVNATDTIRADADRIQERINDLSRFGTNPEGGVSRVAFSQADIDGRAHLEHSQQAPLDHAQHWQLGVAIVLVEFGELTLKRGVVEPRDLAGVECREVVTFVGRLESMQAQHI